MWIFYAIYGLQLERLPKDSYFSSFVETGFEKILVLHGSACLFQLKVWRSWPTIQRVWVDRRHGCPGLRFQLLAIYVIRSVCPRRCHRKVRLGFCRSLEVGGEPGFKFILAYFISALCLDLDQIVLHVVIWYSLSHLWIFKKLHKL